MRAIKKIVLITILLVVVFLAGFVAWANTPLAAMPEALDALRPGGLVGVTEGDWIVFQPEGVQPSVGLILYPGGRVDPRAYAPLARAVAGEGYLAAIAPMPLNLAVFAPDRAQEVMAAYPQVQYWAIGGHSLGGAMAARFAYQNSDTVDGLVLLAAYPASSDDLSSRPLEVVSVIGTRDGLGTRDGVEASRNLLPPGTRYVVIEGGNHAYFGWYGEQPGDFAAEISREAQQEQALRATLDLLERIMKP